MASVIVPIVQYLQRLRALPVAAALVAGSLTATGAQAKKTNTYYSDAEIAAIRARALQPEYRKSVEALRAKADRIAGKSDEDLWLMIPDPHLPRALNVRFGVGCPVHGQQVFQVGGHYPWIMSEQRPFKVQCPVGKEIYPTNDFESYWKGGRKEKLDNAQPYVDGGDGAVDADGNRYWFVAHYVFWQWQRVILDGSTACAEMYLITGEPIYAHKAAIVLARLTQIYPRMDYRTQAYHGGKWPAGINGRILDYIWENFTVSNFARAYDIIYHTLDGNDALQRLIRSHGIPDLKRDIEQNLLQFAVRDVMAKRVWGNKIELGTLSTLALVLDNDDPQQGVTTEQMVDWLLRGDGELEFTFYNGFDRDGMGGESAPSYSAIWNERIVAAAENLTRLGIDVVKDPKWLSIARAPSELRLLDNLSPRLGDCGGDIKGTPRLLDPSLFRFGVTHFADPYCADLLLQVREVVGVPELNVARQPSPGVGPPGTRTPEDALLSRHTIDESKLTALAGAKQFPDAPFSRNLGGYGLAILEIDDGAERRSATLYYGSSEASHGHQDRLTMSYHVRGRDVLTELGYPSHWGPVADYWVRNTPSHYCVMIDNRAQPTKQTGHLRMFADLKGLKLAEAQGKDVWGGAAKDYRRMLALLDTEEKSSLLIDAFFTEGGSAHDYSFHGLPYGAFSYDGHLIRQQEKGTLAGEEVAFAQDPGGGRASQGHQFFMRPRWHEPHDVTRLKWRDDDGLNMDGWFPRFAFDEVVVADTQPPVKPGYPESMPYVLLRGKGEENHQSLFLGIIAVDAGHSPVAAVERIESDSPKAGAAVVTMKSGRAWRIYVNGSGRQVHYRDGSASDLPFTALLMSDSGRPLKAQVVGSGRYEGALALLDVKPEQPLVVRSIDYSSGRVVLDGAVVPGQVVVSRNGSHHASFTVASVEAGGASFTTGLVTGRFLARWDPRKKQVVASERTGGVYNQFVARSFVGMVMISEDRQHTATITGYDAGANGFTVDRGGAAFTDIDDDGRSYIYIADIGPGSTLTTTPAKTIVNFSEGP